MTTITDFLLARIAEDEEAARSATSSPWVQGVLRRGEPGRWRGIEAYSVLADRTRFMIAEHETVADAPSSADVGHIVRHDPARVLAECEAKRRIVMSCSEMQMSGVELAAYLATQTIRTLALVYADHPDFHPDWR